MSAPERIHDPETGVYIGLIWQSRVEGSMSCWAEDRNGDMSPRPFADFDAAFDWLDGQWQSDRSRAA